MTVTTSRVAIITGAMGGIGTATARSFAAAGYIVVLADKIPADELEQAIRRDGGQAVAVQGDLTNTDDIERLVVTAQSITGAIDVLLHNAACALPGTVETTSEADFDQTIALNLKAAFLLGKHTVPIMRASGGGVVLFTAALAGERGSQNIVAYSLSKAALIQLVKCMAVDHARDGIRVLAVSPGAVDTPMMHQGAKFFGINENAFAATAPLGRIVQPSELGDIFVFLASDAARSMTGISIRVDNGEGIGRFKPPTSPAP